MQTIHNIYVSDRKMMGWTEWDILVDKDTDKGKDKDKDKDKVKDKVLKRPNMCYIF